MPNSHQIPKWEKLHSEPGPDLTVLNVRYDLIRNPRNQHEIRAMILDSVDWVNILAVTPEGKIVIVRQYRFGIEKVTAELPGGAVDPGETSEIAAKRELLEETGYTGGKWRYLGPVEPNPAIFSNVCHQWLAEDVVQTEDITLEAGEDIIVELLSPEDISAEIQTGTFRDAQCLLTLAHVFDLQALLKGF